MSVVLQPFFLIRSPTPVVVFFFKSNISFQNYRTLYNDLFRSYNPIVMKRGNDKNSEEDVVLDKETLTPDDIELEDIEQASGDKLKQLREKLKGCEKERMEHLEALQRTKADFLNSKKRIEEQLQRDRERITVGHVLALLPLADSFEAAMSDKNWEECDEKWRKGVEGIYAQLMNILKANEVTPIDAEGEHFNPHEHEAVSNAPASEETKINTVVNVLQKGYRMGDTVLRPAKVIVGT